MKVPNVSTSSDSRLPQGLSEVIAGLIELLLLITSITSFYGHTIRSLPLLVLCIKLLNIFH